MKSAHETLSIVEYVRHRTMMTPVSPLRTKFIHIRLSYGTIHRSFEIIFEWELSTDWNAIPKLYSRGDQPAAHEPLAVVARCQAKFLTSRHVHMHRVIFYVSKTLRKLRGLVFGV